MTKGLWTKDIQKARAIQNSLSKKVRIVPLKKKIRFIAAVDASFIDDKVIAVATLFRYPELENIQDIIAVEKVLFPYIPGFLTFREGPAIVAAIKKLRIQPDLILFDGQGIAHPRGIGIASHLGVILNIPTIGCAKSRLVGEFKEPGIECGSRKGLFYNGKKVGAVLRTRTNVKPVFVSPGHMIDIKSSIEIVMKCISQYRIPEPLRRADRLSKRHKKALMRRVIKKD